jgi:phosphonate transport system substrate-binding protein
LTSSAKTVFVCLALSACLSACGRSPGESAPATPANPPSASPAGQLVIGDIDANDPVRKFEWLKPFADHLASQLTEFGIGHGDVRIAPDMETMAAWLAAGEVDVYLDSLYPAMIVCERSGAVPRLRRWKGGTSEYHTVFLVAADSGILSVEELAGRMLALDDESSTSGFFLPAAYLRSHGLDLVPYRSHHGVPPPDRVGYVFAGDDENAIQWLLSGRVAAAAVDSIALERVIAAATLKRLVVLAETEPVPRQVAVTRPGLDPALLTELIDLLLHLHETPDGRAALESIDTTRFDQFPEGPEAALGGFESTYQAVREWLDG